MTDFNGKLGLVVGVANKRSLAWAIAQATATRGARLALTYQGRFEEHVNELSQGLAQPALVLPCDVSSDQEIASVFARIEQESAPSTSSCMVPHSRPAKNCHRRFPRPRAKVFGSRSTSPRTHSLRSRAARLPLWRSAAVEAC
jgi:NAD(P)-dependent dehydrogenase (short-subunit alcohol dehydrogenase family)